MFLLLLCGGLLRKGENEEIFSVSLWSLFDFCILSCVESSAASPVVKITSSRFHFGGTFGGPSAVVAVGVAAPLGAPLGGWPPLLHESLFGHSGASVGGSHPVGPQRRVPGGPPGAHLAVYQGIEEEIEV